MHTICQYSSNVQGKNKLINSLLMYKFDSVCAAIKKKGTLQKHYLKIFHYTNALVSDLKCTVLVSCVLFFYERHTGLSYNDK